MTLALAIGAALVLVLSPLALAVIVLLQRERLRRVAEQHGFADIEAGDPLDDLQAPAYARRGGRRRRSLTWAIEEIRGRLRPF